MVCSSKCGFGIGFLGKILVALKKLFSSTIFPDFRYMHAGTWFMYDYIYLGIHARSLKCLKKKLEFVDDSPQSTHMYVESIAI